MYDYNNPPYGTPAYFEKMKRLKNAHKAPDPILAQQQIAAAQPPALSAANPLPTTAIPPGTQVNPRQGPTPGQRFVNGATGILGQMTSGPNGRMMGQYGQQSPVEAATQEFNMTSPENLQHRGPERYVPAPVEENLGMDPMTPEESAAFRLTPAGQRIHAAQSMDPELKQPNQTDKRRDKTSFGDYLKKKIYEDDPRGGNSLSSKLIRMGAAMQGSSHQGLNAAMAAMGGEYGNIQREDQAAEQAFMEQQFEQQKAQQEHHAEFEGIISEYDSAIAQMDTLYGDVEAGGGSLTGPFSGTLGAWWDTLQGNPEAYTRLAMDQFKVDEILKNVAKTKGAISDREMATFERPMPSMMADEKVWLDWIYEKRAAAVSVRNKLRAMQGGGGPSNYSPEDQALIDQYSK